MRRRRSIFAKTALAFGTLIMLIAVTASAIVWKTFSPANQTVKIPGLSAPVGIAIDPDGVPHIKALSELDAAAALGYVHARDRMFQMELMRRSASGRIAEIAGRPGVPLDRAMRTYGIARLARDDWAALPNEAKELLEAYARGVNAWIAERGRFAAPEFVALGAPEPWTTTDSMLWPRSMGLVLARNWRSEIARMHLSQQLSPAKIDDLWPSGTPRQHAENDRSSDLLQFAATDLWQASNEWAVDGKRSTTGAPLLAGDPHLGFAFPGLWYLARIDTPTGALAGATAPGMPLLVFGHNDDIAWTFTANGADVQDIFVESPNASLTTREETIHVRGAADTLLTVRESRHGPIVSDLVGSTSRLLALSATNLMPRDTSFVGFMRLNRATSVMEAGEASHAVVAPPLNLLVADKRTIGQFMVGRVPIRKAGNGMMPAPGDGSHDWIGYAEGVQLPRSVAPDSGRLWNANEPLDLPMFPVFLGKDTFGDWRARRIRAMLEELPQASVADFQRMQMDVRSVLAETLLPILRAVPRAEGLPAKAQALLRDWDGTMSVDAPQPLIFNAWLAAFRRNLLIGEGLDPTAGGPLGDAVARILTEGQDRWCDGNCLPALQKALIDSTRDIAAEQGDNPKQWRWGNVHKATFAHPLLAALPVVGGFGTFSIPAPGDANTVNNAVPNDRGIAIHGPSFRAVYDLSNLERSRFIVAPGQSGHPLRAHAHDLLTRWRDGDSLTLERDPPAIAESIELIP